MICTAKVQANADIQYFRGASMRVPSSERTIRPRERSQNIVRRARRSSLSTVEERLERRPSTSKKNERPPGIFGAIFGMPKIPEPIPEKQQVISIDISQWNC